MFIVYVYNSVPFQIEHERYVMHHRVIDFLQHTRVSMLRHITAPIYHARKSSSQV